MLLIKEQRHGINSQKDTECFDDSYFCLLNAISNGVCRYDAITLLLHSTLFIKLTNLSASVRQVKRLIRSFRFISIFK